MENPYSPPAIGSVSLSKARLYSPGQIAWATFLGAPIAGCVLMALNYKRFGNSTAANVAIVAGLVGTILLLATAFILPENFPSSPIPLACTFAMYQCVKALQGDDYEDRLANGSGSKGSGWVASGVAILCLLVILIAIIAFVIVAPAEWFGEEF